MFAAQVVQTEEFSPMGSPTANPSKSSQQVCADKVVMNETDIKSVKIFFI